MEIKSFLLAEHVCVWRGVSIAPTFILWKSHSTIEDSILNDARRELIQTCDVKTDKEKGGRGNG